MRDPIEIKRLEREVLRDYIRKLYASLPENPMTVFEFELRKTIWWDIEKAESEYALIWRTFCQE